MDKRKDIINAARTVFTREGYKGATISKIAKEANLKSHSLVYWYFKDKRELYKAMLEEISPVLNQLPKFWEHLDDPPDGAEYGPGGQRQQHQAGQGGKRHHAEEDS